MANVNIQKSLDAQFNALLKEVEKKIDKAIPIALEAIGKRLSELASEEYFTAEPGNDVVTTYSVSGNEVIITASGEDVLFIEFGTGIPAQNSPHPEVDGADWQLSEKMGAGTYSDTYGKGHWNDPKGWWYTDDSGWKVHTYGRPSGKCMYNAMKRLEEELPTLLKEALEDTK